MITTRRSASTDVLSSATQAAILTAVIMTALYFGRSVFVPLALAVLLSFVLNPLVVIVRQAGMPKVLSVAAVVGSMLVAVGLLGIAMTRQVTDLANDLPRYEETLRQKLKVLRTGSAQSGIVDKATSTLKELGKELDQRPAITVPALAPGQARPDEQKPIPVEVHQPPERPLDTYQRIMSVLLTPLTTTGVVLILVIFILMQREDIRDRIIRLVGAADIELTTAALNDAAYRLSRLFLVQMALNAAYGVVITLGLWAIGVPSPILWGIIAALMRFIPYVGAVLSAVFPVLLAAAVDPGWSRVVWTLALYLIAESAVGHFIEPWVQGKTTGLSPLAIVVSAVLWTALWGPIGLLLATPLTMCLVVLGRHVEGLTFLDVILGDEPALTPAEVFYQRLLAGASAEAADQADKVLKTSTLVDYYDTVALPGLRLASLDAHRGAVDAARMAKLHEGVLVLVDDLSDRTMHDPNGTPDDQSPSAVDAAGNGAQADPAREMSPSDQRAIIPHVLCLGAHTVLDTSAAEILVQILQRNGIGARSEFVAQLSELSRLDLEGIRIVWISSIDASQSHAQIRYLIRKLRRLKPDLIFCAGLWDGYSNQEMIEAAGIAHAASTIKEAVEITRAIASARAENAPSQLVRGDEISTARLPVSQDLQPRLSA